MFFVVFSLLDVALDPFVDRQFLLSDKMIALMGAQNSVNGIAVIFSASSSRTPLTLQMSSSLVVNLASPFYKLWLFGIPFRKFRAYGWYGAACALYIGSFVLMLVDKLRNHLNGELSPYSLLYILGNHNIRAACSNSFAII
jgi:hypothetical protein